MKKVGTFLRGHDVFGEPVTINYKGEANFNTTWGGLLSLSEKIFIFVVICIGLVDLFTYQDLNISSVSVLLICLRYNRIL